LGWVAELQRTLNNSVLPSEYYAQAEQIAGPFGPDVLTLQVPGSNGNGGDSMPTAETEMSEYALKRRTIVIRHASDDRIVALLELVSPGNKSSRNALRAFVDKAVESLFRGFHLLIVDLFPPTRRDPQGIHGAIWNEIGSDDYAMPTETPLTLAAYSAGAAKKAYVEPMAVGREVIEMPLFLEPEIYVNVPLEATYEAAYDAVPRRWKVVLEGADV